MQNKRIISWVVLASVLASLLCAPVFASEPGRFVVSDAKGEVGQNVELTVSIKNNPGIIALALRVCYDVKQLKLITVRDQKMFPDSMFSQHYSDYPYFASWMDALATSNHTEDGILMTLVFSILDDCKNGEARVWLEYEPSNVFDKDLKTKPFVADDGTVTVSGGNQNASGNPGGGEHGATIPDGPGQEGLPDIDQTTVPEETAGSLYQRYQDLEVGAWYQRYVEYMLGHGFMNGMSDTVFHPNGNVTRAQLVTILYRMAGLPSAAGFVNPFSDIEKNKWYSDAVIWAAANGIVNGVSKNEFAPNRDITREQLATILYRYSGTAVTEADHLSQYSDSGSISAYAYKAMIWAVNAGILNGSDGKLMPSANASRVQSAAMLTRYMERDVRVPVPGDPVTNR